MNGYNKVLGKKKEPGEPTHCYWFWDDDGFWKSDCGVAFVFEVGGPKENKFKFCYKCGKHIKSYEPRTEGRKHGRY